MNNKLLITSAIACIAIFWLQHTYEIPAVYVLFIALVLTAKIAVFFKYFKD